MKNNRGFLLAESLVVSTFVLTVLIFLFVQYQNLMTTYKNNTDYNNPEAIYNLGSFGQYLNADPSRLTSLSNSLGSNAYIRVYDKSSGGCNVNLGLGTFCDTIFNAAGAKKVIYAGSDLTNLKNYIKNNDDSYLNQSLRDFIRRIDADAIENKGRLIAQFDNGYYATVALDTEVISDISTDACIIGGQQISPVTSGDGIYKDEYESGRCVYRGENPNNYIRFNNELWRIIAREADGTYKIIRNDVLEDRAFDEANHRSTEKNSYCQSPSVGCGVYAAVKGEFSTPDGAVKGTVTEDSSIKIYLNDDYYVNNINNTAKDQMTSHIFNIGAVEDLSEGADSIARNIAGEKMYTWIGKVGLANVSDLLRASTNPLCTSATYSFDSQRDCNSNYLLSSTDYAWYWTINAYYKVTEPAFNRVWKGFSSSYFSAVVGTSNAAHTSSPRPVVYLTSSLSLSGSGTQSDPYRIG